VVFLLGEPLALDLVNTRVSGADGPRDLIATRTDLAHWLVAEKLPLGRRRTAIDLDALHRIRDDIGASIAALRAGSALDVMALDRINAAAQTASAYRHLSCDDAGVSCVLRRDGTPTEVLLATIADSACELLQPSNIALIRECEGPGCRLLFVAGRASRRWCSPKLCGNRVRVSRHYRKHRDERAQ
jgi:predicted RNA-binding Zn ribbon-like protein